MDPQGSEDIPQVGRYKFLELMRNFTITAMHMRPAQVLRRFGLEIGEQGYHVLRSAN